MTFILSKYTKENDVKLLTGKKEFETGKMYFFQHPAIGDETETANHYFMYDGYFDNWAVHCIPDGVFQQNETIARAIHFIVQSDWLIEFVSHNGLKSEWFFKCFICEVCKDEEIEIKEKHGYGN